MRPLSGGILQRGGGAALLLLLLAVLALHIAVLPIAQWQPDEFILLHGIDQSGLLYVWERVSGWSPRPISELMIWAYAMAVRAAGKPLIISALGGLWALSAAAIYAACRRASETPVTLAAILISGFFLLEKPGVYYWPVGSFAYLTTIVAVTVSCVLASKYELSRGDRISISVALLVACGSSEMGTAFALIYCFIRTIFMLNGRADKRDLYIFLLPVVLGLFIMFVFTTNRAQIAAEGRVTDSETFQNTFASLRGALTPFVQQSIGLSWQGNVSWSGLIGGGILKLLLLTGFVLLCASGGVAGGRAAEAVSRLIALLCSAFASIVFSLRQFGTGCCDRHATIRQALILLALLAAAQTLVQLRPFRWRYSRQSAAAILMCSLLALSIGRVGALVRAYQLERSIISARSNTWFSGRSAGPAMVFYDWPDTKLADQWGFPVGTTLRRSGGSGWADGAVLDFFGKQEMRVEP